MKLKSLYKTTIITYEYKFSKIKYMSLNEVLLQILEGKYLFYTFNKDFDIIWVPLDLSFIK